MKPISPPDWRAQGTQRMTDEQRRLLNAEDLVAVLVYDPLTGRLWWKRDMTPRVRAGKEAGVIQEGRYRRIGLYGRYYMAHRIAWILMTGKWPDYQIDHINGNGSDNRWCNLRAATDTQNKQNTWHANTSGLAGASWSSRKGKYRAQIRTHGKRIFLGWFDKAEDAHAAYIAAARIHHGEFAKW